MILYVVATPIGNLKDITFRALDVLKGVDLILCEDTRRTLKLLNHYGISKPLLSYFQHSQFSRVEEIIHRLKEGKDLALVCDAGTPGISDPGNKLISKILEKAENVKIVPIPGPNAAIAALSISGFPTDKFVFLGFPPRKKGRNKFFEEITETKHTVVFYESSHRILKTLNDLESTVDLVVCRELTKQFEQILRGRPAEITKVLESNKNNLKGEFVIVINHE